MGWMQSPYCGSARLGRQMGAELHFEEFSQTVDLLQAYGVDFTVDFEIVRGLEYYSGTVFEVYAEGLRRGLFFLAPEDAPALSGLIEQLHSPNH